MRRRGFSLIELLLVISIMAVLAAMAAPRYEEAVTRYRSDSAARRIVADLALAQARARQLSSSQTVTFTPVSSQYQIVGMTDPDKPSSTYTVKLSDSPYQSTMVSATFGADQSVVFNGYGVPDSGGTIVVQSGAATRTITLDPDSGVATYQ